MGNKEIRTTQYIPDWWKDEKRRKKVMLDLTRKVHRSEFSESIKEIDESTCTENS